MNTNEEYTIDEIKEFNKNVFKTYQKGDVETRNKIFEYNIGLINSMCNSKDLSYFETSSHDDIFQYGSLGLLHAIDNFDPNKGIEFSTYACQCIKYTIYGSIAEFDNQIRLPRGFNILLKKIIKTKAEMQLVNNGQVTDEMVCKKLGMTKEKFYNVLTKSYKIISANMSLKELLNKIDNSPEDAPLELINSLVSDTFPSPEEALIQKETKKTINREINKTLTDREKQIFLARYSDSSPFYKKSYEKIANNLGFSKQYIWETEEKAIRKLTRNSELRKIINKR